MGRGNHREGKGEESVQMQGKKSRGRAGKGREAEQGRDGKVSREGR